MISDLRIKCHKRDLNEKCAFQFSVSLSLSWYNFLNFLLISPWIWTTIHLTHKMIFYDKTLLHILFFIHPRYFIFQWLRQTEFNTLIVIQIISRIFQTKIRREFIGSFFNSESQSIVQSVMFYFFISSEHSSFKVNSSVNDIQDFRFKVSRTDVYILTAKI
jgi:hypothetical protein